MILTKRKIWIGVIVLVVGVIGIVCMDCPKEKPSVTLSDGTIITVERAEVFSTWPERVREWLRKSSALDDFLNDTLGWSQGWRDTGHYYREGSPYWENDRVVFLKLSTSRLGRFRDWGQDPFSWWVTAPDSGTYEFVVTVYNGELEWGDTLFFYHFDRDGTCSVIFKADTDRPLESVRVAFHTLAGYESAEIPLKGGKKRAEPFFPPKREECKSLPLAQEVPEVAGMEVWLDALPVDFQDSRGIRVLEQGRDITVEAALWRWMDEPPDVEAWKENGAARVYLGLAKWSPKNLPKEAKLEIPPFELSEKGQYREWAGGSLTPEFSGLTLYCLNPGTYFFSGSRSTGEWQLKMAAKSRHEMQESFSVIIAGMEGRKLPERVNWVANEHYNGLSWQDGSGDRGAILEVRHPYLFLTASATWRVVYSKGEVLLCWQKGVSSPSRVNRVGNISGLAGFPIYRQEEGQKMEITLGKSYYGHVAFHVLLSQSDREAWAAHWLEEKAKREKQKQEKILQDT